MKTTRLSMPPCANCGAPNDAVSHEDSIPKEGDISICLYCNHTTVFTAELSLRAPTEAEWDELFKNDDYLMRIRANRELRFKRTK